jgi:CRP-like cAMP-binding protein
MTDLLELSAGLPEVELAAGEVLVVDGTSTGSIWVLVSGALQVTKHGATISTIDRPGAVFGEVSVLLGRGHSATVEAVGPCRLRYAEDGAAFLHGDVRVIGLVASGLAERLDLVTSYLADLRNQYGAAPGIAMVSDVLGRLARHQGAPLRSGSAREPDPEY